MFDHFNCGSCKNHHNENNLCLECYNGSHYREKKYEITFIDAGKTIYLPESKAIKEFGKDEWEEIKLGYLPHIVAVAVDYIPVSSFCSSCGNCGKDDVCMECFDNSQYSVGIK